MHNRPHIPPAKPKFNSLETLFLGAMRGVIPGAFFAFIILANVDNKALSGPRLFKAAGAIVGAGMLLSATNEYVTKKDEFDNRRNKP